MTSKEYIRGEGYTIDDAARIFAFMFGCSVSEVRVESDSCVGNDGIPSRFFLIWRDDAVLEVRKHVLIGYGYTMTDALRIFSFLYGVSMFDLQVYGLEDYRLKRPYGFVVSSIDKSEFREGLRFSEPELGGVSRRI